MKTEQKEEKEKSCEVPPLEKHVIVGSLTGRPFIAESCTKMGAQRSASMGWKRFWSAALVLSNSRCG